MTNLKMCEDWVLREAVRLLEEYRQSEAAVLSSFGDVYTGRREKAMADLGTVLTGLKQARGKTNDN